MRISSRPVMSPEHADIFTEAIRPLGFFAVGGERDPLLWTDGRTTIQELPSGALIIRPHAEPDARPLWTSDNATDMLRMLRMAQAMFEPES